MLTGERTIEVPAPADAVFAVVADVERYPDWQGFLSHIRVRERDREGRPALVEAEADAKVTTLRLRLSCAYQVPARVTWDGTGNEVKTLAGLYAVRPLGGEACAVTFRLEVKPGMRLGLVLRGPVADRVRERVLTSALDGLRDRVALSRSR